MDLAIVPGGNTLFGQKIAERLINLGMQVIALGENFSGVSFKHSQYRCVEVNPFDHASTLAILDHLLQENANVYALVFAGKVTARHAIEEVHSDDLQPFLQANLNYPLQLIHRLLPLLIRSRGYLIRLGWNGRGEAPGYSLDAMVEGGWHHFYRKLFEDVRDTGVKIATVYPEPNTVSSDRIATSQSQSHLNPELIGEAVEGIFRMRESNIIAEIVVRPQATREEPRIPQTFDRIAVSQRIPRLPEKENRLPASPAIVTPEPKRPDDAPPPGTDLEADDEIELDEEEMKLLNRDIESIERATDRKRSRRRRRRRTSFRDQEGGKPAAEESIKRSDDPQLRSNKTDSKAPLQSEQRSKESFKKADPKEPPTTEADDRSKVAKKVTQKVARKVTAKKATKKAVKKVAKKAVKKATVKKTITSAKKVAKKAVKKVARKDDADPR